MYTYESEKVREIVNSMEETDDIKQLNEMYQSALSYVFSVYESKMSKLIQNVN